MSNKFKIRNLENEKRRIDKLIAKLKEEDRLKLENKERTIAIVHEERQSIIKHENTEHTISQVFTYTFSRKGNEVFCTLTDGTSDIVGKGSSKCHSEDLFSEGVGCSLAERRAVVDYYSKIEREETRAYN